jgi:cytochrome P450
LVTADLTPRKVATIEPAVRAFVIERIESARSMGTVDIVAHLFKTLPSFVVAHYLGVPSGDRAHFDRWTEAIVQAAAGGAASMDPSAIGDLLGYFAELIARRRREPSDDIVSDLARRGDESVSLARILGFAFTMVTGGNDTTTGMLAGAACLLTERRDSARCCSRTRSGFQRRRGTAASHLPGAEPGAHRYARRARARRHHPGG